MSAPRAPIDRLSGAQQFTPLTEGIERLRTLCSPYLGIVKDVTELLHDVDDVRSYYIGSGAPDTTEVLGHPCNSMNGGGAFDRDEALAAALGETVERYCGTFRPDDRIVFGSADELGSRCVAPQTCSLFSQEQYDTKGFAYTPFTSAAPVSWIDGLDLRTGGPALLPAQLVLLNSNREPEEPPIAYATSSGLACHSTIAEATLGGMLELLERDAVMIAWHAGLSLPRLDLDADPELAAAVRRHIAATGLRYHAIDLSAINGVPTVLAAAINEESPIGALGIGAASAPTLAQAAIKALLEAYQTRTWSKSIQRSEPRVADDADLGRAIVDFDDHVRYYADPERLELAAFLWASDEVVDPRHGNRLEGRTPGELLSEILDLPTLTDVAFFATQLTTIDARRRT